MKPDIVFHKGSNDKPAIIFIHGLGMDSDIWINPSNSRILGGMFPLKILLSERISGGQTEGIQTLFDDLRFMDYSVITWSQRRPAGPIDSVVSELAEMVKIARQMTKDSVILIGHSRGGLAGRKYLLKKDMSVRGLITISTPHKGSNVAKIAKYFAPFVSMLNPFIPVGEKGTLSFAINRIFDFFKSKALKEILPESSFFKSLNDEPFDHVYYVSVGGTNPTLFSFYNLSIPDIFEKLIPENLYPEEIKKGKGDGLISVESSKIPWCNEHYNFELNHAEILFDKSVRDVLAKAVDKITHAQT